MGVEDGDALSAAVAVAAAHGVTATDAVVLRDQLNVLVHLRPAPARRWWRPATSSRRARTSTTAAC
jgi:hypothetical protein